MKLNYLVAAAFFALSHPALAAEKHGDAHATHGGVAVEAGTYHLELVTKDKLLTLYVNDHDNKPLDIKNAKATANVFSGKDKVMIELKPAGLNAMAGETAFPISSDAKIVVSLTLTGKKSEQARFSLGAKQEHKGHKH
jgi:hypothetical protein